MYIASMAELTVLGAVLLLGGLLLGFDVRGLGTRWITLGLRVYGPSDDETTRRRIRLYTLIYRLGALLGLILLVAGLA